MGDLINNDLERAKRLASRHSPAELWQQLGWAKAGFWIAGLSAFLTMSFFIIQFFAGADIGNFGQWRGVQWFYAFLGVLLSASITAFQLFLFHTGATKEAVLSVVVAVSFGVFCEVSATMDREQSAVKNRSAESGVYKASIQAIGSLSGSGSTLSPAQVALSDAGAKLKGWKTDGKQHPPRSVDALKLKISSLEAQAAMATTKQAGILQDTITTAKGLEQDEANHAQMIRLFMSFGLSAVWASFLFSLAIIGVFEYAFHYMGQRLARLKVALHLLGYDTARNRPEPPRLARPASPALPVPPALGAATGQHEMPGNYPSTVAPPLGVPSRPLGTPSQNAGSPELATVHDLAEGRELRKARFLKLMYAEVKAQVVGGAIQPELPEIAGVVDGVLDMHEKTTGQPVDIGPAQRGKLAAAILGMLQKEGLMPVSRPAPSAVGNLAEKLTGSLPISPEKLTGKPVSLSQEIPNRPDVGLIGAAAEALREAVRRGALTRATFPPCMAVLKLKGIGGSNEARQNLTDAALGILAGEGLCTVNPEYDQANPRNGKPKYLLAK